MVLIIGECLLRRMAPKKKKKKKKGFAARKDGEGLEMITGGASSPERITDETR